jgi:hypothetical protein
MNIKEILYGHTSLQNAYTLDASHIGRKRTRTQSCWVETHPKKGDRIARVIIHPNSTTISRIKYGAYHTLVFLYLDNDGDLQQAAYDFGPASDIKSVFQKQLGQVDVFRLSETQTGNIRRQFMAAVRTEANYVYNVLPEVERERYLDWFGKVVLHIQTRPIDQIHLFPDDQGAWMDSDNGGFGGPDSSSSLKQKL